MLLRALLRLLSWLPLRVLHALGSGLGWLLNRLANRERATTRRNLAVCFPDMADPARQAMARASLRHTACTALEMGKAWLAPLPKTIALIKETEGHAEFLAAVEAGKGVILLAPHLGNWEILGHFASQGIAACFMYQPPRSAALDRLLKAGRSRSGAALAPTTRKGVAQVLAALQRGELVGVLPDQVPAVGSGEFAPFFGHSAYTMTLVSKLARRTGAAVFCGCNQRLPAGAGFRAVFRPVDEAIRSADMGISLTTMNRAVEECVQLAPEQYQWEYKRFRRQPDNSVFY